MPPAPYLLLSFALPSCGRKIESWKTKSSYQLDIYLFYVAAIDILVYFSPLEEEKEEFDEHPPTL